MTAKLIDGKKISDYFRAEYKLRVDRLIAQGSRPGLAVVIVGSDPASQVYVRNKARACEAVGMHSEVHALGIDISQADLTAFVCKLNADPAIHGILVQLPLPNQIDGRAVIEAIAPHKDVDGFHYANMGALVIDESWFPPCTPYGVMKMLEYEGITIEGRCRHPDCCSRQTLHDQRHHDQARCRRDRRGHQPPCRRQAGGRCRFRVCAKSGIRDHAGAGWRWANDDHDVARQYAARCRACGRPRGVEERNDDRMTGEFPDSIREAHRFGDVDPDSLLIDFPSLGELLEARAREHPDALFMRYFDDDAGETATFSYRQFAQLVERAANFLAFHGLKSGDCLATLSYNHPMGAVLLFAGWKLGLIVAPQNVSEDDARIAFILRDAEVKLFLAHPALLERARQLAADMPELQPLQSFDDVLAGGGSTIAAIPAIGDYRRNPALIVYTSGTTGNPKGVALTQYNLMINAGSRR